MIWIGKSLPAVTTYTIVKAFVDEALEFEQIREAAERGDAVAQNNLGEKYFLGQGVSQDYEEAFYWHQKAAMHGLTAAQINLSHSYSQRLV